MIDPRDKMKSIFGSIARAIDESLQESQRRDAALKALKIDTTHDECHQAIGKLAVAIVELQNKSETK
ncbi:hypothetical protein LVY72_12370 [Arthrobacter sp. I2-34]|uniref:Phage protein n=1 Tax=Arthrobacter hankyongi TaxID=2904801 RepID=A0ABS9L859_9MICC|nr:hypothetical protein [Arthrobacter hankyongi]MCG2622698.1 hypothetical protein [Arthrobacter hankyongi]